MKLTIAIPTYNRPQQLKKTLSLLLPQLSRECSLLILDNHSDIPVADWAVPLLSEYSHISWKIERNKVNIGANSNIIRCFEYCETEWLWTLSDDDEIVQNAIEIILKDIVAYNNSLNINYYSPHAFHPKRNATKISQGRLEFIQNIDFFGASIFISANIYNVSKLKSHWLSNENTYSCVPHWLILFYNISDNDQTVTSDEIICYNTFQSSEYSSSSLVIARGFATLIDLITSKKEKKAIISRLSTVAPQWITFENIVKCLLVEFKRSKKELDIKFLLKRYYSSIYKFFGIRYSIKFYLAYLMLAVSPTLTFNIIRKVILRTKAVDINTFIK